MILNFKLDTRLWRVKFILHKAYDFSDAYLHFKHYYTGLSLNIVISNLVPFAEFHLLTCLFHLFTSMYIVDV